MWSGAGEQLQQYILLMSTSKTTLSSPSQPDIANFFVKLLPQNQKLTKFTGKNVFASDFGNCLKVANSDKFLEWIQLRNAEAAVLHLLQTPIVDY